MERLSYTLCAMSVALTAQAGNFKVNDYYVTGDCQKDEFQIEETSDGRGYYISALLENFSVETPYYGGRDRASCDVTLDVSHRCGGCVEVTNASWEGFADLSDDARGFASASFYVDATRVNSDPTRDRVNLDGPYFDMFNLETGNIRENLRSSGSLILSSYAKLRLFGPSSSMEIDSHRSRLIWHVTCCY